MSLEGNGPEERSIIDQQTSCNLFYLFNRVFIVFFFSLWLCERTLYLSLGVFVEPHVELLGFGGDGSDAGDVVRV